MFETDILNLTSCVYTADDELGYRSLSLTYALEVHKIIE